MLKPAGGLRGNASEIIKTVVIDNSDALRPFDAVKTRNGNLEAAAAGNAIFGIIISIVDKNDLPISPEKAQIVDLGDATVDTTVVPPAVTVDSDNETDDLIAAKIDLSLESIFSGDQDGTMNTTNSSDKLGGWIDLIDQRQLDETTYTRTIGTSGQFFGWGKDPGDEENMLVSIHESEVFPFGAGS